MTVNAEQWKWTWDMEESLVNFQNLFSYFQMATNKSVSSSNRSFYWMYLLAEWTHRQETDNTVDCQRSPN